MKKYLCFIAMIVMVIVAGGCSKDVPVTYTKFPPPIWKIDSSGKNPYSMTAVVQLSDTLRNSFSSIDQVAAFVDNECRGTGVLVKTNDTFVYFILIHGTGSEISKVSFKYYSVLSQYMYVTTPFLNFMVDGSFGSAGNPQTLLLTPIN